MIELCELTGHRWQLWVSNRGRTCLVCSKQQVRSFGRWLVITGRLRRLFHETRNSQEVT